MGLHRHPYRTTPSKATPDGAPAEDIDERFRLPMILCRLSLLLLSFRRIGQCFQHGRGDVEGVLAVAVVLGLLAAQLRR